MTDENPNDADQLKDSIRRALESASAANDAAEECSTIVADARKAIAAATEAQRKLTAIAWGALAGALACAAIGGVVYLRSLADLREASELQAAANKASIEQIQSMTAQLEQAQTALETFSQLEAGVSARIDGLGDRLSSDIERIVGESSAVQPQFATAIKTHIDQAMNQTRGEVLTALAELEAAGGAAGSTDPEVKALLTDIRDRLKVQPTAAKSSPATKPKAAPKAKPKTSTSVKQPSGATSFSYP